ncbi:Holliday junction resolvase RuvX [Zhaonella formicivorans]|uniref:Holliday junction resolvase RuvX n=1 Tax=Zhaonella formicivorans TaxID=2528593 RepID=UPI0010EC998B|nr:Holliday junction resolvase RuvX [Zhaonella formicivorans]
MRVLGLDVGEQRIGVALSDPLGWTAQGLGTVKRSGDIEQDVAEIAKLIAEHEVRKVVVGLPKNMNGTLGPQAERVQEFANNLGKKASVQVEFWDERLTTVAAERTLLIADVSRKKRKQVIDKLAAVVILQNYLDSKSMV